MGELVLLVPHPLKRNCPPDSLTRSARGLQPRELGPHRIRGRANRGLGVIAQSKVVLIRSDSPFPVAQFRRESALLAQAGGEERLPSDEVVPVPQAGERTTPISGLLTQSGKCDRRIVEMPVAEVERRHAGTEQLFQTID